MYHTKKGSVAFFIQLLIIKHCQGCFFLAPIPMESDTGLIFITAAFTSLPSSKELRTAYGVSSSPFHPHDNPVRRERKQLAQGHSVNFMARWRFEPWSTILMMIPHGLFREWPIGSSCPTFQRDQLSLLFS